MKPTILPDKFLQCMSKEDRSKLGLAGLTAQEAQEKFTAGEERKFQDLLENALNLRGVYNVRSRMDKATRTRKGIPDFMCCYRGQFLAIECKAGKNELSAEQEYERSDIIKSEGFYCIARTLQDVRMELARIDMYLAHLNIESLCQQDHST